MLSAREDQILRTVAEMIGQQQRAPTLKEIGERVGLRSKSVIHLHIRRLARKGYLDKQPGWRGISISKKGERHLMTLPFAGRIIAGSPLEAVPEQTEISLAELLLADGRYILQIKGDSMIEAGILEGDYVIIQPAQTACDGDIAVVLIDGTETTLKRLYRRGSQIELVPANASLKPVRYAAERIQIQGVLAGQFRAYRRAR